MFSITGQPSAPFFSGEERILVCLSGAPSNVRVIRTGARLAEAFHGSLTALFVETPDFQAQDEATHRRFQANLRLAEELGARITTVYGEDPAVQIAEYARVSGITKLVLGRSPQEKGLLPRKSLVDRLTELVHELDIYIIPEQNTHPVSRCTPFAPQVAAHFSWGSFLRTVGILSLCTLLGTCLRRVGIDADSLIMLYFLGVLCISVVTDGAFYSLISSALSVLIFNFFFTTPYFSLISDPSNLATFAIMFVVALIGSSLTARIKNQAVQSADKAYRTEILLENSQKLQKAEGTNDILAAAAMQLHKLMDRSVSLYPFEKGQLAPPVHYPADPDPDAPHSPVEDSAARWVATHNKHAGASTDVFPTANYLYMPVQGSAQIEAVAAVRMEPRTTLRAFEKTLMTAILDECGLALEKDRLLHAKQAMEESARQEALRANLLRSISHDLRTPLTSISGSASILLDTASLLEESKKQDLYASIYEDATWLVNLVENLLSITRMENGTMSLHLQPELVQDVFAEALTHLDRRANQHHISIELSDELLMAEMDARLIVQVVINLVNNAIKYTQEGSHILLSAKPYAGKVLIKVSDDGPGIAEDTKANLFQMFHTGNNKHGDGRRGLGLGLALCKSIVSAHGGVITAEDNVPHGTCVSFTLNPMEVDTGE